MTHAEFSRKGGRARSAAKTAANRAKASAFWDAVRGGRRCAPRRSLGTPTPDALSRALSAYCRRRGLTRLEVLRRATGGAESAAGALELMATFPASGERPLSLMEREMAAILGARVRLVSRESLDGVENPFRRLSLQAGATTIYVGVAGPHDLGSPALPPTPP